ncbi:cobalt ECF transporter T component CbiQ [Lachnospiraceae bacterium]|nr:cobalt ECF transporter T component CbiQ [Lachnospiraceae bacterium]
MKEYKTLSRREHSHGPVSIDFYASQSGIRQWNGCYKVFAAVFVLILCLILDTPLVSGFIILTMGILNVTGNRVELVNYMKLLKIPVIFLVMGSVAIAAGFAAEPAGDFSISLHWFYIYLTKKGLIRALQLFLKAMAAVSAMYVMTLSTPAGELAFVLQKARLPGVLTELMYILYRFIFILTEVHRNMKTAASSRLGHVDFKTSCATFGKIGGNLLILSMKKANTYYDAMVSRGYAGEFSLWEEEKPVKAWQVLALACYSSVLVCLRLAEGL